MVFFFVLNIYVGNTYRSLNYIDVHSQFQVIFKYYLVIYHINCVLFLFIILY